MAVYDGFFDAVANEETGKFDREYGSGDFTNYFAHIIGSGVCIHNNPGSYKAEFEDGTLYLRPGYLFIQGYWLANKPGPDEDPATYKGYAVALPTGQTGPLAIVAHLNLGKRMIELELIPLAESYPNSLVLALIDPAAGSVQDTRYDAGICGVIDTAGELSKKAAWALDYIDNEIEGRLSQVEADIAEQSAQIDAKIAAAEAGTDGKLAQLSEEVSANIAQAQAQVDKISPLPIGTIQFSAAKDVGPEWLRCDGSFISESQYPELVEALGKLTPSNNKFQVISDGEIGTQISNGVLYNGRMWVYSYTTQKLYGVDVSGVQPVKVIPVTSDNEYFSRFLMPNTQRPICLSIVPHQVGTGAKIFLTQITGRSSFTYPANWLEAVLIFQSEFSGNDSSIKLSPPFSSISTGISDENFLFSDAERNIPYVFSRIKSGKEEYLCLFASYRGHHYVTAWIDGEDASCNERLLGYQLTYGLNFQRCGFSKKSKGNAVSIGTTGSYPNEHYSIESFPNSGFADFTGTDKKFSGIQSPTPMNIVGRQKVLAAFSLREFLQCSYVKDENKKVNTEISLMGLARVFIDAGAYLWGKDIYMVFVGTGIIFSRTLDDGSFGYLDTTSVLGAITQFGYLDYSEDEGVLYIVGQDTANRVKVAKMELNTLFDYSSQGAWLPLLIADDIPAYIKAKEST